MEAMEAMEIRFSCPQEGISELRKRTWFLYLRERLNRFARGVNDGGNKKADPFQGLLLGTYSWDAVFERMRHRQRLRWSMPSRPHNIQVCAIGHLCFLSSLSHDHFPFSLLRYSQSPIACRVAPDRRDCGSVRPSGLLAKALVSIHSTVNAAICIALPSGLVALMSPDPQLQP
jgi:hypothetical protein